MSTAQDISEQVLSDIEKDKIVAFCSDPVLFNAVKKYVLAVAYEHGVVLKNKEHKGNLNFALRLAWAATDGRAQISDEELGQNLRALTSAVQLVESGFEELSEITRIAPITNEVKNPAE